MPTRSELILQFMLALAPRMDFVKPSKEAAEYIYWYADSLAEQYLESN